MPEPTVLPFPSAPARPATGGLGATVDELVARRAAARPGAVAIEWGGEAVSYGELEVRANRLAHALRRLGVGPEVPVAVFLERSPELVATLYAVLKAGGAYVPLDPDFPGERLRLMLEDSGAPVVVTRGELAGRLPAGRARVLCLDEERAAVAARPSSAPPPANVPDSLAYVVYTSGSTGRPKGVAVPHRGIVRLVTETDYVALGAGDRVAQASTATFDAATFEIWGPLAAGGAVVGISREEALTPPRLAAALAERRVSALFLTTALFNEIARQEPGAFGGLRHLLFGGEAVDPRRVREVLERRPPRRLLHVYGPTESTTFSTWHEVREVAPEAATVPIGGPVANTSAHVADRRLRTVPEGAEGELVLGGAGLARGYLGRPRTTAERFVPDPFTDGARLYRTGDRVLAGAAVEFRGRLDQQVKLRGFRVEPREIEATLAAHPAVRESVVLLDRTGPEGGRLAAFVVPDPAAADPARAGEQVDRWEMVFDDLYGASGGAGTDPTFDTVGWVSTFTGDPIPEPEMREWLEDTVERILRRRPRRVLEIGCGTGMLLFRIAGECERYVATDVSKRVLDQVAAQVPARGLGGRVRLIQAPADRLEGIGGPFDAVILNSVVQYFPGADYLTEVLRRAAAAVVPGGAIFVGDVRSLPLAGAYYAATELHRAGREITAAELRRRVEARRRDERELLLDPAYFAELRSEVPEIGRAEVHPKRGRAHNELTAFRFQVTLTVGDGGEAAEVVEWRDGRMDGMDGMDVLRRWLAAAGNGVRGVRGVANARVAQAAALERWLASAGDDVMPPAVAAGGVDPDGLERLAAELGWEVELGWAEPGPEGRFDAVFRRRGEAGSTPLAAFLPAPSPGRRAANDPLRGRRAAELSRALKAHLADALPPYMVPSAFVVLDGLPLTANGKVDRSALARLPLPGAEQDREAGYEAPRTPVEDLLAGIWTELLGAGRIGAADDFFALGGHSLLATQVVSRVRDVLRVELPVRRALELPVLSDLAREIEELRAVDDGAAAPPLGAGPRPDRLPLSFAQERLWFLDRWRPGNPAYNAPLALALRGRLEPGALERAVDRVVLRHEALRTTFPDTADGPVQRIAPWRPRPLPAADLSRLGRLYWPAALAKLLDEQSARPFDLARGPLTRFFLARLGSRSHVLFLSFHHIVFDGWSQVVFFRELAAFYEAELEGASAALAEPPLQYADFALWQRGWLRGERLERELAYWRRRLSGAPAELALPFDRPRPAVRGAAGGIRRLRIGRPLVERLEALARRQGVTLFMVLLSAWKTLLVRFGAEPDVVVGTAVASRGRRELEGLVGFFVNTLALRSDLAGNPNFGDVLERVRETALEAYVHQDLPFAELVRALNPERSRSVTPLVQVMFVLQNTPPARPALAGVDVTPLSPSTGAARFDLALELAPASAGLGGAAEFSSELFDPSTVERLLACYRRLLGGIARSPDRGLWELELGSDAGRHQLVTEWNDTGRRWPREGCVHQMFAARAAETPDAAAVVFAAEHWSYGALDARAGRLAGALRRVGVGTETLVAFRLERSPEMAAAVLAILEAGGAYLPLDPDYPAARLASMLDDSGAGILVARSFDQVPAGIRVISPDAADGSEEPWPPPRAANLAYVIYTSGSTGRPKGVLVAHGGLVNTVRSTAAAFEIAPGSRVLQFSALSFDAMVPELITSLAMGATLVLARRDRMLPGPALADVLAAEEVGVVTLPPSAMAALPAVRLPALRTLVAAGEACPPALVNRWAPGRRFMNGYGPTEATVCATVDRCRTGPSSPPIGRPIANARIEILDRRSRPVPAGAPGELFLGGAGVARGYHRRPALTAARFLPDARGVEPGARLYRSGDLGRFRADGRIEFLGRVDHQVKVRGFRIEPGEIAAALARHPGVREAAVVACGGLPGGLGLVAWWVAPPDGGPSEGELRRFLGERLPDYMVPAVFLLLPALPLTPNGKVDRTALAADAARALANRRRAAVVAPPRTATEELTAGFFAEVLELEEVGVDDDFFDLGGHSLVAHQIVSRIENALGVALGPGDLFDHSTPARLAAVVDALSSGVGRAEPAGPTSGAGQAEPALREVAAGRGEGAPVPLSFGQERLWFLDQLTPGDTAYNSTVALELRGTLDVAAFERTFEEIARRHEVLRISFGVDDNGEPVQRISTPGRRPLPRIDLGPLPEARRRAELEALIAREGSRPFDLGRGPLFRVALARLTADRWVVLFVVHHAVFDGWSAGILIREMAALYPAFAAGEARSPLPPPAAQYGDYALWQRRWLAGEGYSRHLDYWRGRLASLPSAARLAYDRPREGAAHGPAAHRSFDLPAATTKALRRLGRRRGATLFMTLLAAFQTLLHRASGAAAVVVGTPVAARSRLETEGMIGFFTNVLALDADFRGDPTFLEVLGQVRKKALDAYAHQDLPFDKLVESVRAGRGGDAPLFQAMFALHRPVPALTLPGLTLRALPAAGVRRSAAFDLSLGIEDRGDVLGGDLEYDSELFTAATADGLLCDYRRILERILEDPEARIAELPVSERRPPEPAPARRPPAAEAEAADARAELEDRRASLSSGRQALLRRWLRGRGGAAPRTDAISRRPAGEPPELSFAQERLWFLDQLEPGGAAYNMATAVRLRGRLEPNVLSACFDEIAKRHEVLRTTFAGADGRPVPRVAPAVRRPLPLADLAGLPEALRRAELARLAEAEARRPFDLARGPLLRVLLLRRRRDDHVLCFNAHHIVFDGWSVGLTMRELGGLYPALAAGRPSPLAALPIQYADFARWQRRWLAGEVLERQLAYWKDKLAGAPPALDLPADRPRPARPASGGGLAKARVGRDDAERLGALARRQGATLFMVLLAALKVLLWRLSGRADLTVGTPIAGRTRAEVEGLVGFFINTLVLRTDVAGDPGFLELLERVKTTALEAYAHQDLPFEKLVEELEPRRDLARTPFFQVFFNLVNLEAQELELPGLALERLRETEAADSKFDLTLYVTEEPQGLALDLVYNADLFTARRVAALAESYVALLGGIAARPERPIGAYSLRPPAAGLPDPGRPLPRGAGASLPALFRRAAAAAPERTAVAGAAVAWSYGELADLCDRVAGELRRCGIERGQVVAVYGERGAVLAPAILGTLAAGAAFVVLDPAYPAPRLTEIVRQARPRALLELTAAPTELADAAPTRLRLPLPAGRSAPPSDAGPDDLAYLAFTSGSTGTPKGIEGTHRPVAAFLEWYVERFKLTGDDRFALTSGLAHDPMLRDLFTPLTLGARLSVPPPELVREPAALRSWLRREGVSVVHLTPSLAEMLTADAGPGELPAVRLALFGGEPLTFRQVARFRDAAPGAVCVNVYGATETPQVMSFFVVEGDNLARRDALRVPLGRGRDGVDLVVRGERGGLCGPGELGEIWVRSPYLARGYLDDDALTRERFVTEDDGSGVRLYRTGDAGRYRADGAVEFAGRRDRQVNVRGYRVEPAEVEAALSRHPAVRSAAVTAWPDPGGESRLVAYVAAAAESPTDEELSESLLRQLPDYMVPARFVALEALPRTAGGKVDYGALPAPEWRRGGDGEPHVPPRTPLEEVLAGLWSEVLGVDRVGVHDDFFALGGHSLLATRLVARVRLACEADLTLRRLFERPTVAGMAASVAELSGRPASVVASLPPLDPDPARRFEPFPMTDVQQAYWIGRSAAFELGGVATHSYLELDSEALDAARYERAWRKLIARHDMLRAVMLADGRQRVLDQDELEPYRIPVLDLRRLSPAAAGVELERLRDELSHQVLDPERWPLFDQRLSLLPGGRSRLHVSRDALIYDAWSSFLLHRDLVRFYQRPRWRPEPLEITFRDYVLALAELSGSELRSRSEDYWRGRLASLPPAPELPLAADPSSLLRPRFERRPATLPAAEWGRIKARAGASGLTPSSVLLTAYAEVLATWSRSSRFTLNLTLFDRLPFHPRVDELVGDFTSLTLLAVEVDPGESFRRRARRLQERLWDDLDHRLVGGVWVQRELRRRHRDRRAAMPVVFTSTLGLGRAEEEEGPVEEGDLGRWSYSITQTPQVWLDHQVGEDAGALHYTWDSVAGLFPDGLLDAMFEAYRKLLTRLGDEADGAWEERDRLLVPAHQLLTRDALETVPETGAPAGLLHLPFRRQAERRPHAVAVVADETRLTYGELARRSAALARRLRELDLSGPLVAVVMEKGWEQVAAVLGVLEAGAAYLPIDPELPRERRDRLAALGEVEVALTQPRLAGRLEWPDGPRVMTVGAEPAAAGPTQDSGAPAELGRPSHPEPFGTSREPGDLAYVIFTSGSTGEPKGVMIDHRGALNTVTDVNRRFAVGPDDRVLALSSLSFDLSVYDVFGVLAAGGTLVLPEPSARRDPARWAELIERERVTIWNSVPALAEMLAEHLESWPETACDTFPRLRLALLSGDWIPVTLPDRLRQLNGGLRVVSLGGATEASIWSVLYPIGRVDPAWTSIPYGRAMTGQSLHVLDQGLRPRPAWVPGELYIGGAGLALGYWKDEEKTRERFAVHPRTGERLYRTGDLGRYLPDGNVEFLGREDLQVKIRGHRVELGEIETALARHPAVADGVVAAVGDPRGSRRLVAYVVPAAGREPDAEALGRHLADKLPAYMVPALFLFLEALPLTANGKVDRTALPAPGELEREGEAYVAPSSALEKRLADVWAEVLGRGRVGVNDNFFELGGDSVLGIRIAARAAEHGLRITPMTIFEHPSVAALAAAVAAAPAPDASPPDEAEPGGASHELTPLQEGILFHSRYGGEDAVYFTQFCGVLDDRVDLGAFRAAWQRVLERHPVLRSSFHWHGERPRQVVHERLAMPLAVGDWRRLDPARQAAELSRLRADDRRRGFDLATAPLVRVTLVALGDARWQFVLSYHHLLLDGWSLTLVINEVFAYYRAFSEGRDPGLPLPRPYLDYLRWLRRQDTTRAEAYWRRLLAGFEAPTALGAERSSPRSAGGEDYDRRQLWLSAASTAALGRLARRRRLTLNSLVEGAWALLLGRYSGTRDVVFGTITSGRPHDLAGVESMVGLFINNLPARVAIPRRAPLDGWLQTMQRQQLESRRFEYTPLARIQEWSPVPPGVPLFESIMVFENFPADRGAEESEAFERGSVHPYQRTNYPLTLVAATQGQALRLRIAFQTRRFDSASIGRRLAHLAVLLEGMAASPEGAPDDLPLLSPAERHGLVAEWNDTERPWVGLSADRHFADQAARAPERAAVVSSETTVSYGELDRWAGAAAGRLRRMGVGPEVLVGIAVERSARMIAAMLGVLRAGGAYLPLDPTYPRDRLEFMVADSGAGLVVIEDHLRPVFDGVEAPLVALEALGLGDSAGGARPTGGTVDPPGGVAWNLAYVIYTSGSTGRPKGVMVEHGTLADRLRAMIDFFELGPGDRQMQFVSASFDISCEEIFAPLICGAAVAVEPGVNALVPSEVLAVCGRLGVTKLNLPASYWHELVDELELLGRQVPRCLRILVTGAEAPSAEKLGRWHALAPEGSWWFNVYGPTEATIMVTRERWLIARHPALGRRLTLGRPLANTGLHVVDDRLRPQPAGVGGELAIGGPGITRGYLGRPALTAERFLPDPFAGLAGRRLYRTGDLARYLADSRLEFAGRADQQVKVRGFRIELPEIEEQLRRHPAVEEAAVVVREDRPGERRLVAYLTAREATAPSTLRGFLGGRLPDHMVPAVFVHLEEMPLTPNGKLDRRALPPPGGGRPDLETDYAAPVSELERYLTELWQELLGLERVGVDDGFFELGGDSLKGAVFLNRLEAELGEYVYVVALFDAPSVRAFARYLVENYPSAVERRFGEGAVPAAPAAAARRVDAGDLVRVRALIEPLPPPPEPHTDDERNPSAVFVLSPPRSGSTLLRVMLAGHPGLFAPPELDLLSFNTLAERRTAFSGRWAFWLEGTVRAVMEVTGETADEAQRLMSEYERRGLSSKRFYRRLQDWIGDRLLVDKTPSYALDPEVLRRAEQDFRDPRYIHLLRHPCGMIRSFEKARIDQLFFRYPHDFSRRELGELIWTLCHQNISDHLREIPAERRHQVRFEELVADPERVMAGLCGFLGIELSPRMLDPYGDTESRMTDGIHPLAKMLGDVKFHEHGKIDPRVAWSWREAYTEDFLGAPTWDLAAGLGYDKPPKWPEESRAESASPLLVPLKTEGSRPPLFCVHPAGGDVLNYAELARALDGVPVYALQARGLLPGREPHRRVEEMAAAYLEAMDAVHGGPYSLLGWSFGGLVAWEMARQLLARGREVGLLALLDTLAQAPEEPLFKTEAELLLRMVEAPPSLDLADLEELAPDEQLRVIVGELKKAGRLPADVGLDGVRRRLGVFAANQEALRSYLPASFPSAHPDSVVLFRASEASAHTPEDETLGWGALAGSRLEVRRLPGRHETLVEPEHVTALARSLMGLLGGTPCDQRSKTGSLGGHHAGMTHTGGQQHPPRPKSHPEENE